MLQAPPEYLTYEAMEIGATPAVRATFFPYLWPNGVNSSGDFNETSFVLPDRIQADYHGFSGGYWISEIITANIQVPNSPAVITFTWNSPGFNFLFFERGGDDLYEITTASWTQIVSGDTLQIQPYYQFKITLEGYRAWAEDNVGDADDFTAWAEDTPNEDEYQGYAADENVWGDSLTYVEDVDILGEFSVVRDIETPGSLTMEAPKEFDDLVAGDHSGLLLNNRQGNFDESITFIPTPLFSPNKSSFFLNNQSWFDLNIKIELGWFQGGFLESPFIETPMFDVGYSDFITLFLGKVKKWGPVNRAVDSGGALQPNTVEIYAQDFIMDCLNRRIALPASDGSPAPLTFGEFLCKGEEITGWSPAPIIRSAYFESNNYNELDHVVASGGGSFSLVPGLTGTKAFRATVTGDSQSAYGSFSVPYGSEVFFTGTLQFTVAPVAPMANLNMTFLQIIDASGSSDFSISIDSTGAIYGSLGGQSKFIINAYIGVPLSFAVWLSPSTSGHVRLWINGDEVLAQDGDFSGDHPLQVRFGADTGATAESWTIDFDDLEIRSKYYKDAYQVSGAPFADIGPVYIDNLAQLDSQTIGSFVQTLTRFPAYGMVQIESTDPDYKPSGEVLIRVVEHAGGRHALEIISLLLEEAGLTDYIDATAMSAAYAACPDDIIHARFEGGGDRNRGLKDFASLGLPISDALKEITSRCLYWIFIDAGKVKIVPYTGIPPGTPAMALTSNNLREACQTIDLESINSFVSATYGWYSRNPSLFYIAGDTTAGSNGVGRDYTWDSPVACESFTTIKTKVDILLKFLSAQERLEPVVLNLTGARLELMECVSLVDILLNDVANNYWVTRKEVSLDINNRVSTLQIMRFLGE